MEQSQKLISMTGIFPAYFVGAVTGFEKTHGCMGRKPIYLNRKLSRGERFLTIMFDVILTNTEPGLVDVAMTMPALRL